MSQKLLSFLRKKLLRRHQLQKLWLKINGAEIEHGVTFYGKVHIAGNPRNIYIGERTSINEYVVLNARDKIVIGADCHISSGTKIVTTYLSADLSDHLSAPIVIGDNCWIAAGVVVGAGVQIVSGVTVGANSVVLRSLQAPGLYAGAPARQIR